VVCDSLDEALQAVELMMERREFGDAGSTVVIEDRLTGREFSLLTLVGDRNFVSLPVAQDYKRIFDGNLGPNTGGMGSYSPVSWLSDELLDETERTIVAPMVELMRTRGIEYRGTLFSGVMVQDGRPMCIEYNARFGDPETQSILSRLGSGFANALLQAASGQPIDPPQTLDKAAVTVVAASGGYPGAIAKGIPIDIGELPYGVKIFHAGTKLSGGTLATNGGRVLGVTAVANSLPDARALAYAGVAKIHFGGMQFRSDIARDA
jgi:phosphoribosylamine--glycine ligase